MPEENAPEPTSEVAHEAIETVSPSEVSLPVIDDLVARHGFTDTDPTPDHIAPDTPANAPATPPSSPPKPAEATPAPQALETPAEPPAAPEPPPQPDPVLDQRLQVLAERQRSLHEQQQALAQERASFQEKLERFERIERKLMREDALGALKDLGVDPDKLTRAIIDGTGVNPTSELEEALERKLTDTEKRIHEKLQALEAADMRRADQAFVAEATSEISRLSPVVAALGQNGVEAVRQAFRNHAAAQQHNGEPVSLPSYEVVVRQVEQEALAFIRPLLEVESIRNLLPQSESAPQAAPPTLSNQHAGSAPQAPQTHEPEYFDPYDDRDSRIDRILRNHG